MNCREYSFIFSVVESEISDVVSALFHTILLHRTLPTLDFKGGAVSYNSYLGICDVDCNNLDLTYVCINSSQLIEKVSTSVTAFVEAIHRDSCSTNNSEVRGAINLEFVVHRKGCWLGPEASVWERWIVNVILKTTDADDKDHRSQLTSQLSDELRTILEHFNSPSAYAPSLGSSQAETEHIIDFSMCGISPYRFNINHFTNSCQSRSGVSVTMRRIFKDVRL
uniref:Autophagy-related protein 101 n=1 Tax=Schistosoma japonicum TaxID=6182 RepID=C1L4N3_SCHJA|nr:hypothetical protein [Schistosoma japonicum]